MPGGPRRHLTAGRRGCGGRPGGTTGSGPEAEEARRTRYLRLDWDQERSVLWLEGMLPAEEGTARQAAVHARAESIPPDPGAADPPGARLADALVDVATGEPEPATVVVHAEAGVLTRQEPETGPWLAETEGGRRLSSEAIRRLACDGRIEWVLEREGRPVGMGRRGRSVSGSLLRGLRHRDGGACRFPGCERKRWLNAHHLVHWAGGGPPGIRRGSSGSTIRGDGRSGRTQRSSRPDASRAMSRQTGCGPATARGPGAPATRTGAERRSRTSRPLGLAGTPSSSTGRALPPAPPAPGGWHRRTSPRALPAAPPPPPGIRPDHRGASGPSRSARDPRTGTAACRPPR